MSARPPLILPLAGGRAARRVLPRRLRVAVPARAASLRATLEAVPNAMLLVDAEGWIRVANERAASLFGYRRGELEGHRVEQLLPLRMRREHREQRRRFMFQPTTREMGRGRELVGRRSDGVELPIEVGLASLHLPDGRYVLASVFDASERVAARNEAAQASALTQSIIDSAPFAIIATDTRGAIVAVSPAAERMLGWRRDELIGRHSPMLIHDPAEVAARAGELSNELGEPVACGFEVFIAKARRGQIDEREWTYVRKDGTRVPVHLAVTAMRDAHGVVIGYLGIAYDVSERKRADAYIRHIAHHDALTGLPNRALLGDRLEMAIERARRFGHRVGLLLVDLDHFKRINDSLGHQAGDQLLMSVAERLTACVRSTDTVARMGGDEFLLVLPDVNQADDVEAVASQVVERLSAPLRVGERTLQVTPSVGLCLYPEDGEDATTLIKNADTAMYQAKEAGRGRYQCFTRTMASEAAERLDLEHALRHALESGELSLVYQPQLCLRSGRVVGVEALLRWQHPERGAIGPAQFIPLAEQSGLIVPIGEWVLRTACREIDALQQVLDQRFVLAVNLSPCQLGSRTLLSTIEHSLGERDLEPAQLELEITENALMGQGEDTTCALTRLRGLGLRIAIDDFGTGFSSLAYVTRYALDRIKIDRSFVRHLAYDESSAAVVGAIVAMAHRLGIRVVAEGVETSAQLELLIGYGCDEAQGYLFARPVPARALAEELVRLRLQAPQLLRGCAPELYEI